MGQGRPGLYPGLLNRVEGDVRAARRLPAGDVEGQATEAGLHACRQQMRQTVRTGGVERGGCGAGAAVWLRVPRDISKNGAQRGTPLHEPGPSATIDKATGTRCTRYGTVIEGEGEAQVFDHVGHTQDYIELTHLSTYLPPFMIPRPSSSFLAGLLRLRAPFRGVICGPLTIFSPASQCTYIPSHVKWLYIAVDVRFCSTPSCRAWPARRLSNQDEVSALVSVALLHHRCVRCGGAVPSSQGCYDASRPA